jgi:hypothetical protein
MDVDGAYRSGKPLSFGLRQATSVHFNHRQCMSSTRLARLIEIDTEGFELLSNLVAAGNATDDGKLSSAPTQTPLAPQITLAATLVVHPLFTNRAKSSLELAASDEALRFLRHVLQTLGPVNADFAEAFAFHSSRSRGRASRPRRNPRAADDDVAGTIYSIFANDSSLFSQAQGIWHVVGWAFNCSVLWRKRWLKWKLFLEFFVDVLDEYLEAGHANGDSADFESFFQLSSAQTRTALRAVFASANDKSLNEFGEVFKDETRARKQNSEGSKRQASEADGEEFIDHENEEGYDAVTDDDSTPASQGATWSFEATILRARILSLVGSNECAGHADFQDVQSCPCWRSRLAVRHYCGIHAAIALARVRKPCWAHKTASGVVQEVPCVHGASLHDEPAKEDGSAHDRPKAASRRLPSMPRKFHLRS